MGFLVSVLSFIGEIIIILIVVRSLLSWVRPSSYSRGYSEVERFLEDVTEPFIAPVRRFMPHTGIFDFSPLVAVILIIIVIRIIGFLG